MPQLEQRLGHVQTFDQLQAAFGAHDAQGGVEGVGGGAVRGDDGDAAAADQGHAGFRIDDVGIALAGDLHELLGIAGGGDGGVGGDGGSSVSGGGDERTGDAGFSRPHGVTLGFTGTDTHGLKAFHRLSLLPIVEACVIDRDLFTSELVIRAGRAGLHLLEIPIKLHEKRPPSINLTKRVPSVLRGLAKLTYVIRFGGKP